MRQDFFTYQPQFKLLIAGNHKPTLRGVDEALRRRFHLIPFAVTIPAPERDADLAEKLKSEWGGILAWAIEGCLQWQRIGLAPPPAVTGATAEYLDSEDSYRRLARRADAQGRVGRGRDLGSLRRLGIMGEGSGGRSGVGEKIRPGVGGEGAPRGEKQRDPPQRDHRTRARGRGAFTF